MIYQHILSFANILFSDLKRARSLLPTGLLSSVYLVHGFMLLVAILETASVFVITFFGFSIGGGDSVKGNFPIRQIFTLFPSLAAICEDNRIFVLLLSCFVVFFITLKCVFTYVSAWRTGIFAEDISCQVGAQIMRHFLNKPYIWHLSDKGSSTFLTMFHRSSLAALITRTLMVRSYAVTTLFLICIMMSLAPLLACIVYAFIVTIGFATYKLIRKSTQLAGMESAQAHSMESKATSAAINGIREVIIYQQQNTFLSAITTAAGKVTRPRTLVNTAALVPSLVLEPSGFIVITFAVALLIGVWHSSLPEIVNIVFILLLTSWRVLPSFNRVVNLMVEIRGLRPQALPCLDLLEQIRNDPGEALPEPDSNFSFDNEIELRDVFFRYPRSREDCLHGVSLQILRGKIIGIIGRSGAGKSTIATILCGLFTPSQGDMLVDGKALSPGRRAAYCLKVGFVPQSSYLMAGTVADNVAFSEWGKEHDPERVLRACRLAAVDFVETHPKGINIPLGENGSGLSGGQTQRVAIARALYANPEILIFDEATSSLDNMNENIIKATVNTLRNKLTCVIVAHRLTTVEDCDLLYWVENGRVIASGTPEEILPRYRDSTK